GPAQRAAAAEYRMNANFNHSAADMLRQSAGLVNQQNAHHFRARAYSKAADVLDSLESDVRDLVAMRGVDGLRELQGIGPGLAAAITEIATTGRLSRLDRLRGDAEPEVLFRTVPGIGPELARLIHEHLHVSTLE